MRRIGALACACVASLLAACEAPPAWLAAPGSGAAAAKPTAADARAFVARYNAELRALSLEQARLQWVRATYITDDTQWLAARGTEESLAFASRMVEEAKRFDGLALDPGTRRAIALLRLSTAMPAPNDEARRRELAAVAQRMSAAYATGRYCPDGEAACRSLEQLSQTLAESRDYDELLDAWRGWRTVAPELRADYETFASLANEGARELGFDDLGAMWRSAYDMSPASFEEETRRLWRQVEPLYRELHCYVRARLGEHYGTDRVRPDGPIPAHLLGNMWSQSWSNVYDLVEPYAGVADLDVTAALREKGYDVERMFRQAEDFYTSLGLPELPESFWQRSMLTRPADREVVCHPSAWPMGGEGDVRIKMCTQILEEDLTTIFHELGHVYYFLAYEEQPPVFQGGAHDGFHEAIGDTVVLSMTPAYLQRIGLVDGHEADERALINRQMKLALGRIASLPWGRLVDQWRWDVFAGRTAPADYNRDWWSLRTEYQGVAAPVPRSEEDFDPGAKFHVPANTPYTRYFLAHILQFQFHRALCEAAGHTGPLHDCSIYGSREAGRRLEAMLALGQSRPWPDALERLTGTRSMDASAIIDYFAPLTAWLEQHNRGRRCGWTS